VVAGHVGEFNDVAHSGEGQACPTPQFFAS
jgi:hypothetical protein